MTILPGATLGLLGGGQLGRMFTTQARRMGYGVWVLDPDARSPAGRIADRHLRAQYTDTGALTELASGCAAITTEFENVPGEALGFLADRCVVRPPAAAVAVTQDRLSEKRFLEGIGLRTAPFAPVVTAEDLDPAWRAVGAPALLKTSRLGYDGKGQRSITDRDELSRAFESFEGAPCVLERRLALHTEISVVLARSADATTVPFPVAENVHIDGILDLTTVPARVSEPLADEAVEAARRIAEALCYVGTMGVEFFVTEERLLFVNEIAPRPHNTGHYTLDACITDQFEQQVRAVAGLPLGDAGLLSPVAMANLLGDLWVGGPPAWDRALNDPAIRLHLYGKSEPRPGRKMGHLTCVAPTVADARERVLRAREALTR